MALSHAAGGRDALVVQPFELADRGRLPNQFFFWVVMISAMELTTRYTLENWRTEDVEIHDIPESVLRLPFEDVLKIAFGRISSIELNPIELVFSCIFLHDDWRVIRTPMRRDSPAQQHMAVAIEQATGVKNALYGPGVPDFFLWNSTGQHRFVEVKASEDSLNANQREWADTYDRNFFVAQLAHMSDDLSDEEIIERNRLN